MQGIAEWQARAIGPQVPGGRYLCGYWQEEYELLALGMLTDRATLWFRVRWLTGPSAGAVVTHMTSWNARADRVLAEA